MIRGIGELDMHEREKQARKFAQAERSFNQRRLIQQDLDLPYLLLDLRDHDDYEQCHIITALNYPTAMLSRSMNNESPELLAYKNQPGKIIAVYDDDEKLGCRAATTLVQRGYDNLFLLSGGGFFVVNLWKKGLERPIITLTLINSTWLKMSNILNPMSYKNFAFFGLILTLLDLNSFKAKN